MNINPTIITARISGTANTEITARTASNDNRRNSIRRPSARRGSINMVSGTANTEITPSTDNRRISIRRSPARRGSINMARRHSLGANFFSSSSGDPHTHSGNATLCTCDAELMNEELRKFRTTSAEAIQNSWTEVETLQITSTEYDQRLDNLTSEVEIKTVKLQESLTCCNNLEEYLDTLTGNSSGRSSFIHSITEEVPSITEEGPIDSDSSSSINEDATNVHDHDHSSIDQEQEDQDARNCEILRLKQILIARNSTVDNMELLLIQNIKMMQTFQVELQELKESKRC